MGFYEKGNEHAGSISCPAEIFSTKKDRVMLLASLHFLAQVIHAERDLNPIIHFSPPSERRQCTMVCHIKNILHSCLAAVYHFKIN
jgi:hypothetical protein